jgi:outer membrane lipoprotein carrier protein
MTKQLLVFLFSIGLITQSALGQQDPRATKILDQMSAKYKSIKAFKATFAQTLENDKAKVKENMTGDITVEGNKFRLKMAGQEVVNNGTTVYTYLKEENEVNVSNYEPEEGEVTPTNIFNMYKQGYKYQFVEEVKEGKDTYEMIELTPENRDNAIFKIKLKINKKDKTIKSWQLFNKNNGNRYLYTIKQFTPNVSVDAATFTFDKSKYKGVKVIDLR